MYRPDRQAEFDSRIRTLSDHGVTMPPEYDALRRRVDDFGLMCETHPARDRLVDTIVNDASTKNRGLSELYCLAVSEALDSQLTTPVRAAVYAAAHVRLAKIAATAGPAIYQQISDEWNTVAADLAQHAAATNLEATADVAHHLPEDSRQAWLRGEQTAHRLDVLLPVLRAAAELRGLPLNDGQGLPDEAALFALACRVDDTVHRRRAWEAWQSRGRCGRWANLIALDGITIAAADPDNFQRYREPKPMQTVREPIKGQPMGFYRERQVDPEDRGDCLADGRPVPVLEPFEPRKNGKTGKAVMR